MTHVCLSFWTTNFASSNPTPRGVPRIPRCFGLRSVQSSGHSVLRTRSLGSSRGRMSIRKRGSRTRATTAGQSNAATGSPQGAPLEPRRGAPALRGCLDRSGEADELRARSEKWQLRASSDDELRSGERNFAAELTGRVCEWMVRRGGSFTKDGDLVACFEDLRPVQAGALGRSR